MKKTYIIPQLAVEVLQSETVLAASTFTPGGGSQTITPTDDDWDDEFNVKSNPFAANPFED